MREDTPPDTYEIGYWLHPSATGRGLATRAVRAVVAEGFRMPGCGSSWWCTCRRTRPARGFRSGSGSRRWSGCARRARSSGCGGWPGPRRRRGRGGPYDLGLTARKVP
ncbi:GNAT family N-acetyltransferase [Streptomyces sp. SBR177]